ncbi:hypothetical protein J6E39_03770 [bacterium]|nr:hypothetical protein [bacterium]
MKNIKGIIASLGLILCIGGCTVGYANTAIPAKTLQAAQTAAQKGAIKPVAAQAPYQIYTSVNPLDVVNAPDRYLNKNIKIKAKFDKFATLGLDYPPAMKSSENFISFLIQRPDVLDHNIPLSEMKIFLDRKEAEKHIDLNSGDIIEFTGKVFSSALGDPWIEVDKFTVISSTPKKDSSNTAN